MSSNTYTNPFFYLLLLLLNITLNKYIYLFCSWFFLFYMVPFLFFCLFIFIFLNVCILCFYMFILCNLVIESLAKCCQSHLLVISGTDQWEVQILSAHGLNVNIIIIIIIISDLSILDLSKYSACFTLLRLHLWQKITFSCFAETCLSIKNVSIKISYLFQLDAETF